jgi:tetratricopeptide (TPR) repeat protein
LALLDFPHFSGWVAAALLDQPYATGQDLLDDLAEAHLVDTVAVGRGAPGHYRLHDLIRVFARERVTAEEDAVARAAALERVLGALLFLADNARNDAYGGDYEQVRSDAPRWPLPSHVTGRLVSSPWEWFEREHQTLAAAIGQAAREGFAAACWDLADTAAMWYEARAYFDDWRETHQVALEAVRAAGDDRGLGMILYSVGGLHMGEQRYDEARRALESAADLFGGVADEYFEARAIRNLAYIDRLTGDLDAAVARYERAVGVFRRHGDPVGVAYLLNGLAHISLERGDAGAALTLLAEARELAGRTRNNRVHAQVLHRLGEVYLQLDQPLVAADTFAETLSRVQDIGDSIGEAYALWGLGTAWTRTGRLEEAGTTLESALRSAQSAGDRLIEGRVSLAFGEHFLAKGGTPQAVLHLHRALDLFRTVDSPLYESRALAMLANANAVSTSANAASANFGAAADATR